MRRAASVCGLALAVVACSVAPKPNESAPKPAGQRGPLSGPSSGPIQVPSPVARPGESAAPGESPAPGEGQGTAPDPAIASPSGAGPLGLASLAPNLPGRLAPSTSPLLPSGPFVGSFGAGIVSNNSAGNQGSDSGNAGQTGREPSPTPRPTPQAAWAPEVQRAFTASLAAFTSSATVSAVSQARSISAEAARSTQPKAIKTVAVAAFQPQNNGFLVAFPDGTASRALVGRTSPVALTVTRVGESAGGATGTTGGGTSGETHLGQLWVLAELRGDGTSYPSVRVVERQLRLEGQPLGATALELLGPNGAVVWRRGLTPSASLPADPTTEGPHQLRLVGPLLASSCGVAEWPGMLVAQAPNAEGAFLSSSPFDWKPKGQELRIRAFATADKLANAVVFEHTQYFAP